MADFRHYQPRRSSSGTAWRRWFIFAIIAIVIFFMARAIFGGGNSSTNENNEPDITLINNADVNAPANTNTDLNANTNLAVNGNTDLSTFALANCPVPISQYGQRQVVALTFNLVANNKYVPEVLTALQQAKAGASFFTTGAFAVKNEELIKSIVAAGFGVYSQGNDLLHFGTLAIADVTSQLTKAENTISAITGQTTKPLVRMPYGEYTDQTIKAAKDQGYCIIQWTVDAFDWKSDMTADQSKERVLGAIKPGAIVVMSAGSDTAPNFLSSLISELRSRGYEPLSVAQLLQTK